MQQAARCWKSRRPCRWDGLLENPQLVLLQAWLMQSPASRLAKLTSQPAAERNQDIEKALLHAQIMRALHAQCSLIVENRMGTEQLANCALEGCRQAAFSRRIVATLLFLLQRHSTPLQRPIDPSLALMQSKPDRWHVFVGFFALLPGVV